MLKQSIIFKILYTVVLLMFGDNYYYYINNYGQQRLIASVQAQTPFQRISINCGGPRFLDPVTNKLWHNESQYLLPLTLGLARSVCFLPDYQISNIVTTVAPYTVYCSQRQFRSSVDPDPYIYRIPVPNTQFNAANTPIANTYQVIFHFAELYATGVGQRVFHIYVEGVGVFIDLDVFARVNSANRAYIYRTVQPVVVRDGTLTIRFSNEVSNAMISGIEVALFPTAPTIPVPVKAPVKVPTAPIKVPTAPIKVPTAPVKVPVKLPVKAPVTAPPGTFTDILINCGGQEYLEASGLRRWNADNYFTDGSTFSLTSVPVGSTIDDPIYQSERYGTFTYTIPVPTGNYEVSIHLAEIVLTAVRTRIFNVIVETQAFNDVDIIALAGARQAVTLDAFVYVDDGFITITTEKVNYEPKINGIEIRRSAPHLAHSVSNGPYFGVDSNNDGFALVSVDGSESHTHAGNLVLNSWVWREGAQIIGNGEVTSFRMPVGTHDISLTVRDNGNNEATESTTLIVHPFGFPDIETITPATGNIMGGNRVTIRGTGFTFGAAQTSVHFGLSRITGAALQIIDSTTISVIVPSAPIAVTVEVTVQTPRGTSAPQPYVYVSTIPIEFASSRLLTLTDTNQPTSGEFGPDGKLYVATFDGTLMKVTLNEDFTAVVSMVSARVQPGRAILGIAFDPMDADNPNPPVYISSSQLFHGEGRSTTGGSINGKISRVSGANLDVVVDVVTGLPVCDNDHAVNQIAFGNRGELYINIGSNTNGGDPGRLSGARQKESYFSAATVVANLADPSFDGFIAYDALDDGSPINYRGVSVFAPGLRNPFGLTMHSNGNLYATDNGPNTGYGKMRVGCSTSDLMTDQQREDKLVLVRQGRYYGHPNPKRAAHDNDPRQCVWRNPTEPTSANYESPIGVVLSSSTGIIEFKADFFNRQLRGNLIHVKYRSGLLRTVLSQDGTRANPLSLPGIQLVGRDGLDVAQAPNGYLIEIRYPTSQVWVSRPVEAPTTALRVNSVFPSRGPAAGGTLLRLYGLNFGTTPRILIANRDCPIVGVVTPTYMTCRLPGGTGEASIRVTSSTGTYTFIRGYRYIAGTGF